MKIITENKSARFEYFIEDRVEAGISLDGGEVKSIKAGNISLNDSYCSIYQGSVFIKNMHVAKTQGLTTSRKPSAKEGCFFIGARLTSFPKRSRKRAIL